MFLLSEIFSSNDRPASTINALCTLHRRMGGIHKNSKMACRVNGLLMANYGFYAWGPKAYAWLGRIINLWNFKLNPERSTDKFSKGESGWLERCIRRTLGGMRLADFMQLLNSSLFQALSYQAEWALKSLSPFPIARKDFGGQMKEQGVRRRCPLLILPRHSPTLWPPALALFMTMSATKTLTSSLGNPDITRKTVKCS